MTPSGRPETLPAGALVEFTGFPKSPPAMDKTTHFGYKQVAESEKAAKVAEVFHSVAAQYDVMNDLMSAGLHRAWKDALVTAVNPPKGDRPFALLDLAGGTGDIAFRTIEAGGPNTRVTVCDINAEMLAVGRERAEALGLDHAVSFEQGNAEQLPYPDKSFDCVTIAFGIRNVPRIAMALSEAHRVLKRGGRFLCLEFSSVDIPGLDKLYELYSFQVIPRIGRAVTGDREAYAYLVESIRQFPKPKVFARMIEDAGFRRASFTAMTGGVVAMHSGWKL